MSPSSSPVHTITIKNFNPSSSRLSYQRLNDTCLQIAISDAFDDLQSAKIYCKIGDAFQTTYFYRDNLKSKLEVLTYRPRSSSSHFISAFFEELKNSYEEIKIVFVNDVLDSKKPNASNGISYILNS